MFLSHLKEKSFLTISLISLGIALALLVSCWQMNPWPTDAEEYYMPAAKELFHKQFLSDMHDGLDEEQIKWLHGKEIHVLAIALMQKIMSDTVSLKPLLVLGALSIFISSLLIYLIARRLWSVPTAVAVWFLFTSSFWPYLYVLFTKHQTQGLMLFLSGACVLLYFRHWSCRLLAGVLMGMSIFSSTVSFLYVPFFLAALMAFDKKCLRSAVLCAVGGLAVIVYVNAPDIVANIKHYAAYVKISSIRNHFYYNQKNLAQWIPSFDLSATRAGWGWILKYFMLVMPVLFPLSLAAAVYLFKGKEKLKSAGLILLCLLPAVLAEIKGVAQYGANYFPSIIGFLLLVGAALHQFLQNPLKSRIRTAAVVIAGVQIAVNGFMFISDVYPSRMATTLVSQAIKAQGITDIYTYPNHPLRRNMIDQLNPDVLKQLTIRPIGTLAQVKQGVILLPPVSTDTIYRGSNGDYTDYSEDLVLNNLIKQGRLQDYAIGSFKTLGSSLIWSQEEEILAYRYLIRGQFKGGDKAKVWMLDAARIQRDVGKFIPSSDDMFVYQNKIRNIGTAHQQIMYSGYNGSVGKETLLNGVVVRMYKMGRPQDRLRAFLFKVDELQPHWIPYAPNFISRSIDSGVISDNPQGSMVQFPFDPPVKLNPGPFHVVIYREGRPSDTDYYRIYSDILGRAEQ